MTIMVNSKEELKNIINQTTDKTAFVIQFEEGVKDEDNRTEQPRS